MVSFLLGFASASILFILFAGHNIKNINDLRRQMIDGFNKVGNK